MTNSKLTKRSLLASSISLLLCFAMLLGTTFAWFTDSATSAGNKIVAGNLDVQLLMDIDKDGTYETEITEVSNPIFGGDNSIVAQDNNADTLWEPGKTQVAYLAINNAGNLDLKYNVSLAVKNLANDLYEVMEYAIIPDAQAGDVTGWTSGNAVNEGTQLVTGDVTLEKEAIHYFALAIHMKEEAGNEYQEGQVEFDIVVNATQLNSEADSFSTDYDAGLVPTSENGTERELADGSTVFYYNEESGFEGRVRLTALPENLGSEYIVPEGVNDLGGALVGVTLEELTIPSGVQFAYKSLEGATIDEVVLAEGTTTIPNRLFYKANIGSVEIPSSITVIEENAFAQASNVTSLIIPASVTTVEEAAFQHMTNLTTVTFEGNTAIQGYAFRGCANLRTVNLNGDDVTFIASTLNGRNSCWFCNGESNNPNTSNITFNVINDTVAARVKTAMGAEKFGEGFNRIFINGVEWTYPTV